MGTQEGGGKATKDQPESSQETSWIYTLHPGCQTVTTRILFFFDFSDPTLNLHENHERLHNMGVSKINNNQVEPIPLKVTIT